MGEVRKLSITPCIICVCSVLLLLVSAIPTTCASLIPPPGVSNISGDEKKLVVVDVNECPSPLLSHPYPKPCINYTISSLPPKVNGNYTLRGNDKWIIDSDSKFWGNVTLYDNSSLTIKNAKVTFNGTFWGRNSSTVAVKDADLTLNIWSVGPVKKDQQYNNPNGFVLMEDTTSFIIEKSHVKFFRNDSFSINLPGTERVEQVFILFGEIRISDSIIDGWGPWQPSPGGKYIPHERGGTFHGNSHFLITNVTMFGFITYVNAHGNVERSNISTISVDENTGRMNVFIGNCTLRALSVIWVSGATLYHTTLLNTINVKDSASARLFAGTKVADSNAWANSLVNGTATLYVEDSMILDSLSIENESTVILNNASLGPTDQCFVHQNGKLSLYNESWIYQIICYDKTGVSITNSSVDDLVAINDAAVRLKNSTIKNTDDYQTCVHDNATIYIDTVFVVVTATVNGKPMPLYMECYDDRGNILAATITTKPVLFPVTKQIIKRTEIISNPYCTIDVHRGKLSQVKKVNLASTKEFVNIYIPLTDKDSPQILKVTYDAFDTGNSVTVLVRAKITDAGIGVQRSILRYSTNGGRNWSEESMYYLGNDTYESALPEQAAGTEIRFFIFVDDFCLNNVTSGTFIHTVPQLLPLIGWTLLGAAFIMLAVIIVIGARKHRIKRRYLRKR